MLVVGVRTGREVIVGDHTVVTVSAVEGTSGEVKLGFISEDDVHRVSNPQTTMRSAKIKARAKRGAGGKMPPMEHKPVYVASYVSDGQPQVKAALSSAKASFPGASISKVDGTTSLSLASHEFVVLRCATERQARALRWFCKTVAKWPVLDELEDEDSTIYLLLVRTVAEKTGGDVLYFDSVL